MDRINVVPFIIDVTISHPPGVTLTSHFDQAGALTHVQHRIDCDPACAAPVYQDAILWTKLSHGTISPAAISGDKLSFSVMVPVVLNDVKVNVKATAGVTGTDVPQASDFFLANAENLFWHLTRQNRERQADAARFVINLTINHPPWFILTSQFIQDDDEDDVQYFLTGHGRYADSIYDDAKRLAKHLRGSISPPVASGEKQTFTITVPIVRQTGGLDGQIFRPGAFFLTNAEIFFWAMARPLQQLRLHDLLRQKFGPKKE